VEALLRKHFWIVDFIAIGLVAVFLARAAAGVVESRIVVPPRRVAPPAPVARAAMPLYGKQVEKILERNVFCSTCPPILPKADEVKSEPVEQPPQKSSLPLSLIVVLYSPPPMGLKWSVAVIRDTEDKSMGPFNVGAKVRGATITEIEETRIYFDNQGKTEFLDLLEAKAEGGTLASAAAPAATPVASDALSQEMDRGIKKVSENQYELTRAVLESVLGNMNLLSRSARIVPEIRDGRAAGFRLYSVRPEGPFAKIGMQNGDVISSINGLEITSPEKALEVYAKLKSASHLSIGLERNGQRITKEYGIR
jgi:general secretion pathway protein C